MVSWSRGLAGLGARAPTRSPRASSRSPCSSRSSSSRSSSFSSRSLSSCLCVRCNVGSAWQAQRVGDAWAHDRPVVDGFLVRLSVAWSLGFAVLGARSSWSSRAHPLASCFVSLALMVSRISSVYLSKWHSSWRVRVREALSSWDRVLGRLVYLSRSSWARARTRSSGTSSRSSWSSRSSSSRSSSSRSSSSRSSSRVCEQ